MTEKREFYGSSVEAAVDKAAADLGVTAADLDYVVLDEGNAGFLGIGARDARVQVEGPPEVEAESAESPEIVTEPAPDAAPEVDAPPTEPEPAEETAPGDATPVPEMFAEEEEEERVEVPEDLVVEAGEVVTSLLEAMGFESRVDAYDAGGFVAVDVAPDNTALFIGQKGETIDALQYLVNAGINKKRAERTRIILDAEGYRQRRVEAIQGMAHRTARRAMRESRAVELPPMNPAERRVVHLFLKDNPNVTTNSEGMGDDRRVRISPA